MEVYWSETITGETFSACSENQSRGCQCPQGFCGDGHKCEERSGSRFGWFLTFIVLVVLMGADLAGYIFYKYRLRSYMDSEIMAIMSQYMPIDNQHAKEVSSDVQPLRQTSTVKGCELKVNGAEDLASVLKGAKV